MINALSGIFSAVTRKLSFIPGMYFVTKPFHSVFSQYHSQYPDRAWRIISLNGYKMKVNASYRMGALIYWRGAHEWAPMFVMKNELKKGMVVYDIGANIGEISLFCAHHLGADAKVYSFEPMNETFEILKENIGLNNYENRITAFKIALSDKNGEADLFAATEVDELGSFEDGLHTLYATNDRSTLLHKIKLEKLDDKTELPAPDFIKIDVEGAELFALRGAAKIIEKFHPKILMEFSIVNCTAAGYTQQDLLDFLKQFGYKFYVVENRGKLKELDATAPLPGFANLYCQ